MLRGIPNKNKDEEKEETKEPTAPPSPELKKFKNKL